MTRFKRVAGVACFIAMAGTLTGTRLVAQTNSSSRAKIVGAWLLESRTVRLSTGETIQDSVLGSQPIGRLVYDASGVVMLTMMRQGRTEAIGTPTSPAEAKNPRVILGYDAYFGTYTIDDTAGTITHHVEGSLFPEDLGKDFTRAFTVKGDTFTLSFESKSPTGAAVSRTLVFHRAR